MWFLEVFADVNFLKKILLSESLHVYWILIVVLCVCVFNHRLHGTPRNPYNVNYYTGGSSSGSAAAVAAGKNVQCGL